jgi:hypothetical protein
LTGSIFIAMVPPVAMNYTCGRFCAAAADAAASRLMPNKAFFNATVCLFYRRYGYMRMPPCDGQRIVMLRLRSL